MVQELCGDRIVKGREKTQIGVTLYPGQFRHTVFSLPEGLKAILFQFRLIKSQWFKIEGNNTLLIVTTVQHIFGMGTLFWLNLQTVKILQKKVYVRVNSWLMDQPSNRVETEDELASRIMYKWNQSPNFTHRFRYVCTETKPQPNLRVNHIVLYFAGHCGQTAGSEGNKACSNVAYCTSKMWGFWQNFTTEKA